MVQCSGIGKEEGWWPAVFALTSAALMLAQKGLLPPAQNTGGFGEFSRCQIFFLFRPQIGVLADKNGRGIEAVHCFHGR